MQTNAVTPSERLLSKMANMFEALNRFIARLDSDTQIEQQKTHTGTVYGFQVLRNSDPDLQLEPWFDFIIGINGHNIDNSDPNLFLTEVHNCAGTTISLGVYGIREQTIREVYTTIPTGDTALGLSLQWVPLTVAEDVWHILDVMPNSPADVAGLLPYGDYVIGSPERQLHGESALGELVEDFTNSSLRLYVYNHEYDVTRMVTITPAKGWGGEGALGCVLGYGALHRVPAPLNEPSTGPGETMFESGDDPQILSEKTEGFAPASTEEQGADFLVPASMQMQSRSPPPPPSGGPPQGKPRKQRAHHATTPAAGLDDYFAEGEQKSREMDGGSTAKANSSLPPPPKGGPPKAASPAPTAE